jgi:phage FluMu protein gp41
VIPDVDILERRIAAMRDVPWPMPAVVLLQFTDEDLDRLDMAGDASRDDYWHTLNEIVRRISIYPGPHEPHWRR